MAGWTLKLCVSVCLLACIPASPFLRRFNLSTSMETALLKIELLWTNHSIRREDLLTLGTNH